MDPEDSQPDHWNDSLAGDYLWSNVNFGEAVTQVMTPLTWSMIQFTLGDWVFLPGFPTVGAIGGRPYLNISVFATLFYGLGRSQQDLLSTMEATLHMRLPPGMVIPAIAVPRRVLWSGFLRSLRVRWKQRQGARQAQSYLEANRTWFQTTRQAIASQTSEASLQRLWQSHTGPHIQAGAWRVLGSATYSADYTLRLRRRLEGIAGPQDANLLIGNLGQAEALLESLGPLAGLSRLARGEISRGDYLEIYGHRGPDEFELSAPRPAEDPTWLEQELEKMRQSPLDVDGLLAQQRQSYAAAWGRFQQRSPREARRAGRKIAESARRGRLRELARSAYVRDRWAARLFALRAGELTGLGERVFYLRLDELLRRLSGDRSVEQRIDERMAAYQRYKDLPPYPSVIRGRFDPFDWAADPHRPSDIYDEHKPAAERPQPDRLITGAAGSAGIVEGSVRLIARPEDGGQLQQGEILVAVQTDIAWTLLFPRASAILTDVGAPLSHAAIVARELGIPAVVGCGDATARLHTGDRVRVDGGRGTVEIL